MTIGELRKKCARIKGVKKLRVAKSKDGVFVYFKELFDNGRFYNWVDFVHLDDWKYSIDRVKVEHERFYI